MAKNLTQSMEDNFYIVEKDLKNGAFEVRNMVNPADVKSVNVL